MRLDPEIKKYHYACQSMLSNYVPTDSKGDINMSKEINEDDLFLNTFVSVRYRTHLKNDESAPGSSLRRKSTLSVSIFGNKYEEESSESSSSDEENENKYYSTINIFHLKFFE